MNDMEYFRDPVSIHFDAGARRLLERAHAAGPGNWVTTRLVDPTPQDVRRWQRSHGIDVTGPDNASADRGTGLNAKTRWARAFVRSCYRLRGDASIEIEIGRQIPGTALWNPGNPRSGGVPPGRLVRLRIRPGGRAAIAAVRRLPSSARIFNDDGSAASRWSDPYLRDWQ